MKKKITSYLLVLCVGVFFLGTTPSVFAKENGKDKKKTSSINFEDELIQGQANKPELLYLLQKKQFNFKRLIKLRKNFLPEMRRTAEEIQPGGS